MLKLDEGDMELVSKDFFDTKPTDTVEFDGRPRRIFRYIIIQNPDWCQNAMKKRHNEAGTAIKLFDHQDKEGPCEILQQPTTQSHSDLHSLPSNELSLPVVYAPKRRFDSHGSNDQRTTYHQAHTSGQ
jgi:hypothetical protein